MSKKTELLNDASKWGFNLRLTLTTTEQVDLEGLGKMSSVKVSEGGALRFDIPVDDLTPERPCDTTLLVTTHTNPQGVVRTDIKVDPNCFYHRDDPIQFLCRILKLEPGSLIPTEVQVIDGEQTWMLTSPKLDDGLFAFPNGFLLEKST
ncbi:MAG: hypothetical protein COV45_06005 [Deltaproteobacteria bacterium CG11_big_fil_rev_8_21_14_0_20_47_16]|nr:MAG: hypothetical protein COV45_06005 [Deltaproteobacteria bacterium CG11_big_fil_rev_8_21_14_0_20_47_16]